MPKVEPGLDEVGGGEEKAASSRRRDEPEEGVGMATAQATKEKIRRPTGAKSKAAQGKTRTRQGGEAARGATIPVPVPEVHTAHVPVPEAMGQARQMLARQLPPPERLAFYGALAAGAIFGIIDWPVAAAIGLGAIIARRTRP
jgi:hypothetical protein